MDKVEFQPSGEGDGSPPGRNPAEFHQLTEEEQMRAAEEAQHRERGRTIAEFLSGRDIDPGEVWIALSHDILLPSEKACIPLTQYEYAPYLKEVLRRAGATYDTLHLEERRAVVEERMRLLREEKDQQLGLGTDEGKEKAEIIARQINTLGERLYGKEEEVEMVKKENGVEVKKTMTVQTRQGLVDRLNQRLTLETGLDERKEWEQLYWKLRGSITLTEAHVQREKAMSSVKVYCEELFLSGFYKVEMQMKEMLALLEDEEYGLEIEEAMRAYTDIHIGEGVKVKFGEFSQEFDDLLAQELTRRGRKFDRNSGEEVPLFDIGSNKKLGGFLPPLWIKIDADIAGRQLADAYARERAARARDKTKGEERYHVAERAEILAKRIMEFGLLTVWLSVPRDENGEVIAREDKGKVKFPDEGCGRLEGGTSCDLAKEILTKYKFYNERNKHKPAGVSYWEWEKVPFEGFSPDMFHCRAKVKILWHDETGKEVTPKDKDLQEGEISIFDLWYWGKNRGIVIKRGGYRLAEIFRGINLGAGGLEEIMNKDEMKVKASRTEITQPFSQNWFDSYHFSMYRQHQTKDMALSSGRGGKEDCITSLLNKDSLEIMTKDIGTALSEEQAEWFKFNLVLTRIMSWYDVRGNQDKADFPLSYAEYKDLAQERAGERGVFIGKLEIAMIYKLMEKSGFLEPASRKLLKRLLDYTLKGEEPRMLGYGEFWKLVTDPKVVEGEGFLRPVLQRVQRRIIADLAASTAKTEKEKATRVEEVLRIIP